MTTKKLETLAKEFKKATDTVFEEIVNNDMVDVSGLTDKEKFSVLVYSELQKVLNNKEHSLVLDCNYAQSKNLNHEDPNEDDYLVDYYRLVPVTNPNSCLMQIKAKRINPEKGNIDFTIHTSCAKCVREQLEAMEDELHFTVERNPKTQRAKTSTRKNVQYTELPDLVKALCKVLANKEVQVDEDTEE